MNEQIDFRGLRCRPTPPAAPTPAAPATPEVQPSKRILVHRRNVTREKKPTDHRCGCAEYIPQAEANALIESGEAEWLTITRGGKSYLRHSSIVIWQSSEQLAELAVKREAERKEAAERKAIAGIIEAFRKKLKPEENKRWSDQEIIEALENKTPPIVDGIGADRKLLDATNKELAGESDFIRDLATTNRVHAAFFAASIQYWNMKLTNDGLTMNNGRYMTEAPKGCGELVSGGYGVDKIADVDAARQSELARFRHPNDESDHDPGEGAARQCSAANFVPGARWNKAMTGSGDIANRREIEEARDETPIYNSGTDGQAFEVGDEERANRIREKWLKELFDKPGAN